jgi:hypothetical protein
MPDVHLPQLEEHSEEKVLPAVAGEPSPKPRKKRLATIALEVVLISCGVFLGLLGEQARETLHRHELAKTTLEDFRSELSANRKSVADRKDYHATTHTALQTYFQAEPTKRAQTSVHMKGIQTPSFEHTAWDVALGTQTLAYLDPQLVFALSRVYNRQRFYETLSQGLEQAMYINSPYQGKHTDDFLAALTVFYDDVVDLDPQLLQMYDELEPQIDHALGEPSKRK